MPTNNFLPFTPSDTGTNLLSQSDYAAATDRTIGNQPGVASSKLNNKALRQATYIASQVAQYLADKTGTNVLDDAIPAKLLAQMNAALLPILPVYSKYTSGSGTHNFTMYFFVASANATAAATYTNNGVTYTVKTTIAGGVLLACTGNGAPTASGTLTKASGTGDSSISFYAVRLPTSIQGLLVGGGGGGAGSGTSGGGNGATGGDTTFGGAAFLKAAGGVGATGGAASNSGGDGGSPTVGAGPLGIFLKGGRGGGASGSGTANAFFQGGQGGSSALGGAGSGGAGISVGQPAAGNTGSGGGGAGSPSAGYTGPGGGSGALIKFYLDNTLTGWAYTFAYAVGALGGGGTNGAGGALGGDGGSGIIEIYECF